MKDGILQLTPKFNDNFEKIRTISGKNSNRI